MNERFNELRLDAGIARVHDEPYLVVINKSGEIIDPIIGLEKFARLIVAECVIQCEREWIRHGADSAHNQAIHGCINSIKQHFGVEE